MKKLLIVLLSLVVLSSAGFAMGLLDTATTIGSENMAVQGWYTSTPIKAVDGAYTLFGGKFIYGATQDLDLNAKYGMGGFSSSDLDVSESGSLLSVGVKYAFLKASSKDPIDLAGVVELASISSKSLSWSMNTFGVVASKLVRPNLSIYGTFDIVMNSIKPTGIKASSSTGTMIGGGVKYQINKKFDVLGEITVLNADSETYQTFAIAGQYALD